MYSFWSFWALLFPQYSAYFGMVRDAYEAYALYMFFSLLLEYGGGWNRLAGIFSEQPPTRLLIPLWCRVQPNKRLLVFCRQGILQYTLVKPLVSVTCAFLLYFGYYEEGEWHVTHNFYLFATIINNICVTLSLYFLALFYKLAKEELKPYSPVLKFASIKMIVFFCYWQSVVIAIVVAAKWVPSIEGSKEGEVATFIQNGLICIEMFFFSIFHFFAFPSAVYSITAMSQKPLFRESDIEGGVIKGVKDVTNQKDLMVDTYHSFVPKNIRESIAKVQAKGRSKSGDLETVKEGNEMDEYSIFTQPKIDRRGLLTDDFVHDAFQNLNNAHSETVQLDEDVVPDDNMKINDAARR